MQGFPGRAVVKNLTANSGDTEDVGSIPGSERFLDLPNVIPLLYSCQRIHGEET